MQLVGVEEETERIERVKARIQELESGTKDRTTAKYKALQDTLLALEKVVQQRRSEIRLPDKPLGKVRQFPVDVVDLPADATAEDVRKIAANREFVVVRTLEYVR